MQMLLTIHFYNHIAYLHKRSIDVQHSVGNKYVKRPHLDIYSLGLIIEYQ